MNNNKSLERKRVYKQLIKRIFDKITLTDEHPSVEYATKIISHINAMCLKHLENVRCGDALFSIIKTSCIRCSFFNILKLFLYAFSLNNLSEKRYGDDCVKIAFLFSNSSRGRNDHLLKLTNVANICKNRLEFLVKKREFSFKYMFFYFSQIYIVFSWIRVMHETFSYKQAVKYSVILYIAYFDAYLILKSLIRQNIPSLVVTCDHTPLDSILVQKAKQNGIITATLQHGHYEAYEGDGFEKSYSDYFLAFGQATIDNAGKYYNSQKYIKVGMPQFIDVSIPDKIIKRSFNVFLLIMSGCADEEIVALRETEKFISKHPSYKRIIKLHPRTTPDIYDYKWLDLDEVITDEYTVYELINRSDFAVIPSGSTVFTEYMVMLFPAFLFEKERKAYERLSNREFFRFTNAEELEVLVGKIQSDEMEMEEQMKVARAYFTEIDDIAGKYREFLERFSSRV